MISGESGGGHRGGFAPGGAFFAEQIHFGEGEGEVGAGDGGGLAIGEIFVDGIEGSVEGGILFVV